MDEASNGLNELASVCTKHSPKRGRIGGGRHSLSSQSVGRSVGRSVKLLLLSELGGEGEGHLRLLTD